MIVLYKSQAEFIASVLDMLNTHPTADKDATLYLHVEIREEGSHRVLGNFSDEIADDCWSFGSVDGDT